MKSSVRSNLFLLLFLLAGSAVGLVIRYRLLYFGSMDFWIFLDNWYEQIKTHGWLALRADFSNYSPLYIYLLASIHTVDPALPNLFAVKIPSILMDLAIALFGFGLVWSVTRSKLRASFAFLGVFFAPTVILNSAYWGQSDSLYTAFLVACVWLMVLKKFNWAMLAYGAAFAFKMQSVFLAPLIAVLFAVGYIPWPRIFLIPLPYLLSIVPAWIAGRPLGQLLLIFWNQAETYKKLTLNAPTAYAWFFDSQYDLISKAGIFFAVGIGLLFAGLIFFRKRPIGARELVLLATASVILMPFVLPSMHDRYFYPADVFSILLIFCYPELFPVPILSQLSSLFSYQPFLTDKNVFPLSVIAFFNLTAIVLLIRRAIHSLYFEKSKIQKKKPAPHSHQAGARV